METRQVVTMTSTTMAGHLPSWRPWHPRPRFTRSLFHLPSPFHGWSPAIIRQVKRARDARPERPDHGTKNPDVSICRDRDL